jgi:hypothetical protein
VKERKARCDPSSKPNGKGLSIVLSKFSRGFLALSTIAILGGCNSTGDAPNPFGRARGSAPVDMMLPQRGPTGPVTPVVQAYCPQVVMRDQDAVYRAYAKGGQDNAEKLLYQASLAEATRQCTANETTITINVVAQGRIVQGPAGASGKTTLPVLVEVLDGSQVLYSQKVAFPVDIPSGGTQFIFSKPDVQIPNAVGGASRFTRVRLGFDTGPVKKPGRRG